MNQSEQEKALAGMFYQAIQDYSSKSERSAQAGRFQAGVSDLGWCSERLRRMLDQQSPDDTDVLAAFIGTALGDHIEKAVQKHDHGWVTQPAFVVRLKGEAHTYDIPGHGDLIHPSGLVVDVKSAYGLAVVERHGHEDRQKKFQRHLQALGAFNAGYFNEGVTLDDIQVGNAFIDRAAQDKFILVHLEPYDPEVVAEATAWLDEVVYCYTHEQEAPKEPPREVCFATCGFFDQCRGWETDVKGLIDDPEVVAAMDIYREGLELTRQGNRLKDQAKGALSDITGFALLADGDRYGLRWTWVNETEIEGYTRKGYWKIEMKKAKRS